VWSFESRWQIGGVLAGVILSCGSVVASDCVADLDDNGLVNAGDLGALLGQWGESCCNGDLNGDGSVDAADVSMLLSAWNVTCPPEIDSLTPNTGSLGGGEVIAISGRHLAAASEVRFGEAVAQIVSSSGREVIVVAPAGSPGLVDLHVSAFGGQAVISDAFAFGLEWASMLEAAPDPTVVANADLVEAIHASGLPWRIEDRMSGIEMLLVPPGSFLMGCSASSGIDCYADEYPVHPVTLTQAFYLGRYEVTQAEWTGVMGYNPSFWSFYADSPSRPVEGITRSRAEDFQASTGLRLPTEAEWEYACRAGTTTAYNLPPSGTNDDALLGAMAWFGNPGGNSGGASHPVGLKLPNTLGFHDMHGNIFERCSDWYSSSYFSVSPSVDPMGPKSGTLSVFKGGVYGLGAVWCRSSARSDQGGYAGSTRGLRVARTPLQSEQCSNGRDDDGDGLIDCADVDCALQKQCQTGGDVCGNGLDDDGDGLVDCDDPDCTEDAFCADLPWAVVIEVRPDPAIVLDETVREAIVASGFPWRVKDAASDIELLLVPAGTYSMGCRAPLGGLCSSDEGPVHPVVISEAFYLGRYEVTQAQWQAVMGYNPSEFRDLPDSDIRPVEKVSWNAVQGFEMSTSLRLPTEAEWEFACRAGTSSAYHNGSDDPDSVSAIAWFGWGCAGNSGGQTHPVGEKIANRWGFHDMLGNVSEWVEDKYSSTYYEQSPILDPPGPPSGQTRVLRGGDWDDCAVTCRVSNRFDDSQTDGTMFGVGHGFRVARTP
jgi:formylglycine-generating enzyme required for sulfatase activity